MEVRELFKKVEDLKPFLSIFKGENEVTVDKQIKLINKLREKVNTYTRYEDAAKALNEDGYLTEPDKEILKHVFGSYEFEGYGENQYYQKSKPESESKDDQSNQNEHNEKQDKNQKVKIKPPNKVKVNPKQNTQQKQAPYKPIKRTNKGEGFLNKAAIQDSWYEDQDRQERRRHRPKDNNPKHGNKDPKKVDQDNIDYNFGQLYSNRSVSKSAFKKRNNYAKYDKDGNVLLNKNGKVKTYGKIGRKMINFGNNVQSTNIAKFISYIIIHARKILWSMLFGAIAFIATMMILNILGIIHTLGHSPFEYCSSEETSQIQQSDDDLVGGINMKHPKQRDIDRFLNLKITDTFGISDAKAERWFLNTQCYAVRHFGLNKSNIHQVTEILHKYKISPIYFYMYSKEENGNKGGFINNTTSDVPGGIKGNAEHDAKMLWVMSKDHTQPISWVDAGNPADIVPHDIQEKGNQDFKKVKNGTIGRAYMKATAAAAWGWRYKKALTIAKGGPYANPWTDMMSILTYLGGTPGATSDIDSMSGTCGDADSDSSTNGIGKIGDNPNSLASKAAKWILNKKNWNSTTTDGKPGIDIDSAYKAQCVDLSMSYFKQITKSSTLLHGNGNSIVNENTALYKKYGWKVIHNPKLSDLKVGAIVQLEGIKDNFGHTEVIASLDAKGNMKMLSQNPESPCYLDAKYNNGKINMLSWGWNMPVSAIAIPPASALK